MHIKCCWIHFICNSLDQKQANRRPPSASRRDEEEEEEEQASSSQPTSTRGARAIGHLLAANTNTGRMPAAPPPVYDDDDDDDGLFADSSPNLGRIVVACGPDQQQQQHHQGSEGEGESESPALQTLRAHGAVILRDSVPQPLLDECRAAVGRVTSAIVADARLRAGGEGGWSSSGGSGFDDPKVGLGSSFQQYVVASDGAHADSRGSISNECTGAERRGAAGLGHHAHCAYRSGQKECPLYVRMYVYMEAYVYAYACMPSG